MWDSGDLADATNRVVLGFVRSWMVGEYRKNRAVAVANCIGEQRDHTLQSLAGPAADDNDVIRGLHGREA